MNRQEKLIAEIHAEFDTAQDRLLKEAKKVLSNGNEAVVSISDRLKAIGFTSTPTAKHGSVVKKKLVESSDEARLIEYYSKEYPFLKFLTESELDRICKKYNLVYAPSDRYTEEVPEKNITDIENAQQLKEIDREPIFTWTDIKYHNENFRGKYLGKGEAEALGLPKVLKGVMLSNWIEVDHYLVKNYNAPVGKYLCDKATCHRQNREGVFIAAPRSHFNTQGLTKKGLGFFEVFKTEIKDPIVFRYVRGGVQVLTKWGLEANDPDLVVPKLN